MFKRLRQRLDSVSVSNRSLVFVGLTVGLGLLLVVSSRATVTPQGLELIKLDVAHNDNFGDQAEVSPATVYLDSATHRTVNLMPVPGKPLPVARGRSLVVQGRHLNASAFQLVATPTNSDGQVATATTAASVAGTRTTGTFTTAVILANFSNDTSQPVTPAAMKTTIFTGATSANQYLKESSFNKTSLVGKIDPTGDVFGWVTLSYTNASCSQVDPVTNQVYYNEWRDQAVQKAGINEADYDFVVVEFGAQSCNFAGLYLGGGRILANQRFTTSFPVTHEMGHAFDLPHAHYENCTTNPTASPAPRTPFAATCYRHEYGDPYSAMGASYLTQYDAYHKASLGWIPATNVTIVGGSSLPTTTNVTLVPEEISSNSTQLVRVFRGNINGVPRYFNLDYRQSSGSFDNFSATGTLKGGLTIRDSDDPTGVPPYDFGFNYNGYLLDTTSSTSGFEDAGLPLGQTLTDPTTGIAIKLTAASAASATVAITMPGDSTAPTPATSISRTRTGDTAIKLDWSGATDNIGVAQYAVYRNDVQVAVAPLQTYTDSSVQVNQRYNYYVVAIDGAGNRSVASPSVMATTTYSTQGSSAYASNVVTQTAYLNMGGGTVSASVNGIALSNLTIAIQYPGGLVAKTVSGPSPQATSAVMSGGANQTVFSTGDPVGGVINWSVTYPDP